MVDSYDFVEMLGQDVSLNIFMFLEDPADLVRACAVSISWRRFVIENALCKQLCLRMCPELSNVLLGIVEMSQKPETDDIRFQRLRLPRLLNRDHRVFSFLGCGLTLFPAEDCIFAALGASSTDNVPRERVENTLQEDVEALWPSYWSSKGEIDPAVPETLIYNLVTRLCLISEIYVQPFQAYFEVGAPIYSAKAVRFYLGYMKSAPALAEICMSGWSQDLSNDMFIWTYISPEYPMSQANNAQKFQLPRPVLCMGGILKVELLGRAQKEEIDGLYYICVSRVQAMGRSLGRAFDIEILGNTGKCMLKYYPEAAHQLTMNHLHRA